LQLLAARQEGLGEPTTLERVFQEHHARVFRAAHRVTGNVQDAEDVLQTVFLRLARRGPDALPVANLPSYLYRAAINASLDLIRARRDSDSVDFEETAASLPAQGADRPDERHEAAEIRHWLRRALARLHPRAAEVFALRYLEGRENREIAGMLGTSRVAVAVTLHRARRRLQKELRLRNLRRDGR